jgi:hypothetical protein
MADNTDSMVGDIELAASSNYLLSPITLSLRIPSRFNCPFT